VRTGLFTSPHLVDFRERIRVDGVPISPESFARALARVEAVPAPAGSPRTFFEATFGIAALAFAEAGVEWAVIETGLGGRLDATNVITPALSVITPIGLDHREILGDTLAAIATEKAGIIKPGVPVVVAPQADQAFAPIAHAASAAGAPILRVDEAARTICVGISGPRGTPITFVVDGLGLVGQHLALVGRHQVANARLAIAALGALAREVPGLRAWAADSAIMMTRWPGRFERSELEPRLWWDGGHNADGARVARETWREALGDPPGALVLGVSSDKDLVAMLEALHGPWRRVHAVAADQPRAVPASMLADAVRAAWPAVSVTAHESVAAGVEAAIRGLAPDERAFVTGSLFVVGEAMDAVGEGDVRCD